MRQLLGTSAIVFSLLCSSASVLNAQESTDSSRSADFSYPLDVQPMSLSGNYGELRPNHYHGGVDFRIGGVVGAPVYASDSGYVSRISVSASGYGNCLYLTHPNGFVTVYGHLNAFEKNIAQYVEQMQYEKESFSVDLECTPDQFPVKKRQRIAFAGNTGASGGPHLHFEVRDAESNIPLSFMERGYITMDDSTEPNIAPLRVYGWYSVEGVPQTFEIPAGQDVVQVPEHSYIGINSIDHMEGSYSKFAVMRYKAYLDNELFYDYSVGEVPFEQGRYINSIIDYRTRVRKGVNFVKTWVEEGNALSDHISFTGDGLVTLSDSLVHTVKVECTDWAGNTASRSVKVQRNDAKYRSRMNTRPEGIYMNWALDNIFEDGNLKLVIPAGSLYSSIFFKYLPEHNITAGGKKEKKTIRVYGVHNNETALHSGATLYIKYNGSEENKSKALIALCSGGSFRCVGTEVVSLDSLSGDWLKGHIGSFGNYTVVYDTQAPNVNLKLANGAALKAASFSFTMGDNLSGIKRYRVEIDGHWVLAQYDLKYARVTVPLKSARIKKGIMHECIITVEDNKGNVRTVTRKFRW